MRSRNRLEPDRYPRQPAGDSPRRRSLAGRALRQLALVTVAGLLCGPGVAIAELRLDGTVLQLSRAQASWSDTQWRELFGHFEALGLRQLVVQWSVTPELTYYPSDAFSAEEAPVVEQLLELAGASGISVLVGLAHDPGFEPAIRRDPELVEVYLRRLRRRSLTAARELSALLGGKPSFSGWYLPEEIDDVHWLEPERRRLLTSHLGEITSQLRQLTPQATLAISGFSNSHADPEALEGFWRDLLEASSLDRVLFQDGIGVGKQWLDDLPLYLSAVARAATSTSRQLQVVVEVFQQVDGPPLNDRPFRAIPAAVDRVRRQLEIARRHAPAGVIAFAVPEYMTPGRGEAAARLYRHFLDLRTDVSASEAEVAAPSRSLESETRPAPASELAPALAVARAEPEDGTTGDAPGVESPTAASSGTEAGQAMIFELQLGLFHRERNARTFIEDLKGRKKQPYIFEVLSSQGLTRYTVRVGPYRSMDEAAEAAGALKQQGIESSIRYRVPR